MLVQFALNLGLTLVWVLLLGSLDPGTILVGFLLGAAIIYLISRRERQAFYLRWLLSVGELLAVFAVELLLANLRMAYQVLHPRLPVRPGFVAVPLDVRSDGQITLLANMVTLTPGTLAVDVSPDRGHLVVHVLDLGAAERADAATARIKHVFERRILKVWP